MIKEVEAFVEKIPENSRIAIFGAGFAGIGLKKYIDENRKDIKITFFIDSFVQGEKDGLKIIKTADIDDYKKEFDLLICATRKDLFYLVTFFDYIDINYIYITREIEQYFRLEKYIPLQKEAVKVFTEKEDIDLYNMLWEARLTTQYDDIAKYVLEKHNIGPFNLPQNYLTHYLEYINRDAIKTIIDAGFFNGCNSLVFHKYFKNHKKTYAFEPMYEKDKTEFFDKLIKKADFCEIIPYCLYDKETKLNFAEQPSGMSGCKVLNNKEDLKSHQNLIEVDAISADIYNSKYGLDKIDFIKMDIEGSEMNALKGAINTIREDRPQLAISIYHSLDDFVQIPVYLKEILDNYIFRLGHYNCNFAETVLYAIPKELYKEN